MTLNNLKGIIEEFGSDHYMVNTTIFCSPERVDLSGTDGFVLWFYPNGVSVEGTSQTAKYQVVFMDVTQKDRTNEKDALSDCERLTEDFCAFMDYAQYIYGFQFGREVESSNFIHNYGSDYVGVSSEFEFTLPNVYDYCEVAQ